jgi:RNA polymerase sigma factor (sigma-70 family)
MDMWHHRLHRFAAHRLADDHVPCAHLDPDDVVQVTWLVLYLNQNRIDRPDRYMYTVDLRLITRAARETGRYISQEPLEYSPRLDPWVSSAEQEVIDREATAELAAARRVLTRHQQIVLNALYDEGLPYEEVAGLLGISVGAVSAHRARALDKMRANIPDSHADVYPLSPPRLSARRHRLVPVPLVIGAAGIGVLAAVVGVVPVLITIAAVTGIAVTIAVIWWIIISVRAVRTRRRKRRPDDGLRSRRPRNHRR